MSAVAVESRELPAWYQEAVELVAHARTGRLLERKKIGNNTWARIEHPDGEVLDAPDVVIRLHSTDVVRMTPDGLVTVNSGGWRTMTTKERLHRYAPGISVESRRGRWIVRFRASGVQVPFADGLTYRPETGEVVGGAAILEAEEARQLAEDALKDRVRAFCNALENPELNRDFIAAVVEGGNWAGDCWYCLMRDADGKTLGDASGSHFHLQEHLDETYLVPSLFRNAFRERWGDKVGDHRLWLLGVDLQGGYAGMWRRDLRRTMVNYFLKRLILEGGN